MRVRTREPEDHVFALMTLEMQDGDRWEIECDGGVYTARINGIQRAVRMAQSEDVPEGQVDVAFVDGYVEIRIHPRPVEPEFSVVDYDVGPPIVDPDPCAPGPGFTILTIGD
jgi:hypothetical protein